MQVNGNIARVVTPTQPRHRHRWSGWWLLLCLTLSSVSVAHSAELEDARKLYFSGKYKECIKMTQKEMEDSSPEEEWRLLQIKSMLAIGRYTNALDLVSSNLSRYYGSVQLRLLARDVYLNNGQPERARTMLEEINQLAVSRSYAYRDPPNLVTLGRAGLLLGGDPKLVLEKLYDPARKADPSLREIYLASGELALDKNDFDLASKTFKDGLKRFPDDAEMLFGFARCFANERTRMLFALDKALQYNPNFVPALLLQVDHLVDAEEYAMAKETLDKVSEVNAFVPEAWAYRAVLAHLAGDSEGERKARKSALKYWDTNPEVDYLIGKKLSQKYRFAEGAKYQRQALKFDKEYLPARIQLAQDLLRLGEEDEGWDLAGEVNKDDGYDVVAYNLVTLKDTIEKFKTITNEHFIVRMGAHESEVWGRKALELLTRARAKLCEKYGMNLEKPTIVEIFPDQKDFGVRTFGMPGNPGYLGVCFGSVITANSPASQAAHPSNWEAVLWHEFCHVVTLQMTHNKMPRWLSEGISVYEELQENPVWGQAMNPRYREMVLGEDLTPVGELSGAFLAPRSDLHLQFAYYESSLVVEFLVKKYGMDKLKAILRDLGEGMEVNAAIARNTTVLGTMEKEFAAFAKERAENLAPTLGWEKPKAPGMAALSPTVPPPLTLPGPASDDKKEDSLLERLRKRREAELDPPKATNAPPVKPEPKVVPAPEAHPLLEFSLADWTAAHPTNFYALTLKSKQLVTDKKWAEAKAPLQQLLEAYPGNVGADNPYVLLAAVHRGLGETNQEREVLTRLAARSADDLDAYLRLMELAAELKDWPAMALNARRFLAVNPLVPQPYRHLARAAEQLNEPRAAIEAYTAMLLLDPPDPAEVHFRLARLLFQAGDPAAKRHVLQALEEAPRYREAHRLLLEINEKLGQTKSAAAEAPRK